MKKLTLLLCCLFAASNQLWGADPPEVIYYQGVLRSATDEPKTGPFNMSFRLFGAASGGTEVLCDSQVVDVDGGLFSVRIGEPGNVQACMGAGNEVPLARAFARHSELYLEVQVEAETLSPRIRIGSAGYALNARHLRGREIVSEGPIDLYVDTLNGDDTDSGLSPDEAKRTIQAAIDAIPSVLTGEARVHIEPGVYNERLALWRRVRIEGFHWIRLFKEPTSVGSVVIDGTSVPDPGDAPTSGVFVSDVAVEIKDVTVRHFTASGAFDAEFAAYLKLNTCRAEDNYTGVGAFFGTLVEIRDSVITQNQFGVVAASSAAIRIQEGVEISDNTVRGVEAGHNSSVEFAQSATNPCRITNNELRPGDHSTMLRYTNCDLTAATCIEDDASARCVF